MNPIKKKFTVSTLISQKFSKGARRISKRKRKIGIVIHQTWIFFESKLYNLLKSFKCQEIKISEFNTILWKIREEIIENHSHSKFLQDISLFIFKIIKKFRRIIKNLTNSSKISLDNFISKYFGGHPEFEHKVRGKIEGLSIEGVIDQIIFTKNETIIIKDLKPDIKSPLDINYNPYIYQVSLYAIIAENLYKKTCEKLILVDYNLQYEEIPFDNDLRQYILNEISTQSNIHEPITNSSESSLQIINPSLELKTPQQSTLKNFMDSSESFQPEFPNLTPKISITPDDFNSSFQIQEYFSRSSNEDELLSDILPNIEQIESQPKVDDNPNKNKQENDSEDFEVEKIGWCIAKRIKKPKLSLRTPSKIEGYIEDSQKIKIIPGLHVVVDFSMTPENIIPQDMKNVKIISKIIQVRPFTDLVFLVKNSTSENIIEVELEPLYEISEDDAYKGPVRPHLFDGATIRFCSNAELIDLLQIPIEGFELGEIEDYGERKIKYKLPEHKLAESISILGTQGTGKTTLIYGMSSKFVGDKNLSSERRPTVVILDIESEYQNLGTDNFKFSNEGFMRDYGIDHDLKTQFYKIGNGENEYTLDFSLLDPEDYKYFIPDLTTKSAEAFESIAKKVRASLLENNQFSKENLLSGIKMYVQTCPPSVLHSSTAQAITRGCEAKNFELFDKLTANKLRLDEFVKPGRLIVIDLFDLSDQQQRIVALYFIMMFYRLKMKANTNKGNILQLVVDEAHRIFPNFATIPSEREYINRIVSKISEITHRGRKRNYGIIFATQSPRDLRKELITMCNTKILFRIVGESNFLNEILGKRFQKEIKDLPTGVGIITCQGIHKPLKVRFPFLQIKDF